MITKTEGAFDMNPASIMKLMSMKQKFEGNHPRFVAFLNAVFSGGIPEGSVIEITLSRPGEEPITTNMRVLQSDLDMLQELKDIAPM